MQDKILEFLSKENRPFSVDEIMDGLGLSSVDDLKGEMVIVVEGNTEMEDYSEMTILEHINLYLEDGMSEKDAIKKVAVERDIPKSVVYKEYHIDNK